MSLPVVGICASVERARWNAWDVEVNLSQRTYSEVIAAAGAQAVILPPGDAVAAAPAEALRLCDALILAGGADLDPASYGAEPHPSTTNFRADRDRFELALARGALERDLPVLGICRGMQILNVARGGTLDQDLETTATHLHTPGDFTDHEVRLEQGSLAASAVGAEIVEVSSHHHQGLADLGDGIVATGHCVADEVIEAIELPENRFALGVLWHAEEEERSSIVAALREATHERIAS